MIEKVRCAGCGGDVSSRDRFAFTLAFERHRWCHQCLHSHDDGKRSWSFCSALCVLKHVRVCMNCTGSGQVSQIEGEDMSREAYPCSRCGGIGLETHR